jgi:glycosyltransferase involved in cell wall biosynthesis
VPWSQATTVRADILVLNTSGGGLDLRPILDVDVKARLRVVWVQGMPAPQGLHDVGMDFLCAPSNFIRRIALRDWGVAPGAAFVAYNAADGRRIASLPGWGRPRRDPRRLVYTSHPSKGLDAALGVLRILRQRDAGFTLHVYGGARLWGEAETAPSPEAGLVYHGLTGQARLARELSKAGILLNLQSREEPLPLAAIEAMRAGCLVLASPVGGYPEIIRHGHNGFLVPGDHRDEATWQGAAELIAQLVARPDHAAYVRRNATTVPWDWDTMARTWVGHWDWALDAAGRGSAPPTSLGLRCDECGGPYLPLSDGYHCTACGRYDPRP